MVWGKCKPLNLNPCLIVGGINVSVLISSSKLKFEGKIDFEKKKVNKKI